MYVGVVFVCENWRSEHRDRGEIISLEKIYIITRENSTFRKGEKKQSRPWRSLRLETKMYQLEIIPLHIIHTTKV